MRVEAVYRAAERGGRWPRRRRRVVVVVAVAVVATWHRASERARWRESLGRSEKGSKREEKEGKYTVRRERIGKEKRHICDRRERERYLESETIELRDGRREETRSSGRTKKEKRSYLVGASERLCKIFGRERERERDSAMKEERRDVP